MDDNEESLPTLLETESSTSSVTLHIPQVSDDCKPKIGQIYDALDDVFKFYKEYAKEGGFGVRSGSTKRRKDEIAWKEYVCSKQGYSPIKMGTENDRNHGILRVECKAKICAVKVKWTTSYRLSQFFEGHNYLLTTPNKVHLLRCHRNVPEGIKSLTKLVASANIPTHKLVSVLELESGGIQNIGCIEKDIRNYKRDLKEKLKGHDADLLNEYFLHEQEKNSSFVFSIKADEEGKLKHCFWADLTSRRAYGMYGDVVVFDSTYNTNRYRMIFAPLMGVNNHWRTVIFGCSFLSDETSDSFIWLFEE